MLGFCLAAFLLRGDKYRLQGRLALLLAGALRAPSHLLAIALRDSRRTTEPWCLQENLLIVGGDDG